MKGNNELILCHDEIIRAVEYYLNEVQFKERVKVDSVSEDRGMLLFVVELSEWREEKGKQ